MTEYCDFTTDHVIESTSRLYCLPKEVRTIIFRYDGGRVSVYINGEWAYSNQAAGDDFELTIS